MSITLQDTAILGPGQGATPFKLTTSQVQELTPRTAFATFDGSGAASPFLASLAFYAPDGTLLSRTFPTTTVPAGGTADVSFAPFPGGLIQTATGGDLSLLWEFTVGPFSQALVRTNVDGPMAKLLPQTFKTLEIVTLTHEDTLIAGRADIVMKFPPTVGNEFRVLTQELAGNVPTVTQSYIVTNGVVYCGAGRTLGKQGAAMQTTIPGYSSTVMQKAGNMLASAFPDDTFTPPEAIQQTIGFGWMPAVARGIDRISWATIGPAGITEFAVGSYFAVYGRT